MIVPPAARRARRAAALRWSGFVLLLVVTAVVLAPLAVVVAQALGPAGGGLLGQLRDPRVLTWFGNSALVTGATVLVALVVATPAGYVLSRGRGRAISGYAVVVFGLQSLPAVVVLVPLFLLLADLGLVDTLGGLTLVHIGLVVAVAVWTMSTAFDAVPVEIERAAWLDGCSVAGAFGRIVLPNAGPGVLSTAVVTFLFSWNDYLIALIFVRSEPVRTIGLALKVGGGSPALALLALLPPVLVFAILHRSFRFGGVGGALADR